MQVVWTTRSGARRAAGAIFWVMRIMRIMRIAAASLIGSALIGSAFFCSAHAARVSQVSPQGEVAEVRQIVMRFDAAVVPAGDPRLPAPYTLQCNGSTPPGDARWLNDRQWVYDLRDPLAAGQRCTLKPVATFAPLGGAITGPKQLCLQHRRSYSDLGHALPRRAHRRRPALHHSAERRARRRQRARIGLVRS